MIEFLSANWVWIVLLVAVVATPSLSSSSTPTQWSWISTWRRATLTVDGAAWPTSGWEGDGPGGHHREGELRFEARGPAEGDIVLSIDGLSEPFTSRWPAP
jgi:hypothetical protein